jgi:hypothetical protein
MRTIGPTIAIALMLLVGGAGHANTATASVPPGKTMAYALIAAIGDDFNVVTEEDSTGSRLRGYNRDSITVTDNLLNRIALQSLEKVVAQIDPASKRTYLALAPQHVEKIRLMRNESDVLVAL